MIKTKKNNTAKSKRHVREESVLRENFIFIFSSIRFFLRSTEIGPQVFIGTEGKVDLHDESYAWTPKS